MDRMKQIYIKNIIKALETCDYAKIIKYRNFIQYNL